MRQVMKVRKNKWPLFLDMLTRKVTYKNDFLILFMSEIHHLPLCILLYVKLLLLMSLLLRISVDRYDGASNMHGEWKGLQALFLNDYPCAYYIHCMAHRLQLVLVATTREVSSVHEFFQNLSFIVNAIGASCKRQDELQATQAAGIAELLEFGEINTGKGANQIGTLKRVGDTRWTSHFTSTSSLLQMYNPTCTVLENIKKVGSNYKTKGDASIALKRMTSFEFVFILHMMKQILGITNTLCQALQQKSQDNISAITMVSHTKKLIETFRDNEWATFLDDVIEFCKKHDIDIPEFKDPYFEGRSNRKGSYRKLIQEQEIDVRKFQLKHFEAYVKDHPLLGKLSSIVEVCQYLVEIGKASHYYLVDRLIRLVLTLPVSTATTERAFFAMKIVKNRLRNKMDDDFIADSLVLYIEKDIAKIFSLDPILND
ncbi:uncharacterized protein LOC111910672 [Lactuca sativa]|uniref:uncharacterized protein LOC111910672 n=1 Tax=Lactuca sativa TaxID=4236 RepID=UPI000CD86A83|nr:uncharacterized protein LOC111910672 [Lactuca sativa]